MLLILHFNAPPDWQPGAGSRGWGGFTGGCNSNSISLTLHFVIFLFHFICDFLLLFLGAENYLLLPRLLSTPGAGCPGPLFDPPFWLEHICTVWQFLSNFSMTWVGHFPLSPLAAPPENAASCLNVSLSFLFFSFLRGKRGKMKGKG